MSSSKKYTVSVPEVALLATSYFKARHGIALEVDLEALEAMIAKIASGSLEVAPEVAKRTIKILEVDLEKNSVKFVLPEGFPVVKKNPDRNAYYALTPLGDPAVAKGFLDLENGVTVRDLERDLKVSPKKLESLEVGDLEFDVEIPSAPEVAPEVEPKAETTSKKPPKKERRKIARIADHESHQCTCNKAGHTCPAVDDYGAEKHVFS